MQPLGRNICTGVPKHGEQPPPGLGMAIARHA
jgi:hypothetical protein